MTTALSFVKIKPLFAHRAFTVWISHTNETVWDRPETQITIGKNTSSWLYTVDLTYFHCVRIVAWTIWKNRYSLAIVVLSQCHEKDIVWSAARAFYLITSIQGTCQASNRTVETLLSWWVIVLIKSTVRQVVPTSSYKRNLIVLKTKTLGLIVVCFSGNKLTGTTWIWFARERMILKKNRSIPLRTVNETRAIEKRVRQLTTTAQMNSFLTAFAAKNFA